MLFLIICKQYISLIFLSENHINCTYFDLTESLKWYDLLLITLGISVVGLLLSFAYRFLKNQVSRRI